MVSLLEQQVRSFYRQHRRGVSSREVARRCSEQLGISYRTAEAYVYAFVNNYDSHAEYQEARAIERGHSSLVNYHKDLSRRMRFKSFKNMQNINYI